MSWVSHPFLTRRAFLAAAAAAASSAAPQATRWALLSDTHIPADPGNAYRGFQPYENLKRIVPAVQRAGTGGLLVCGDLARLEGLPEDYENLRKLLGPLLGGMPAAMVLGNHDDRKNFLAAFGPAAGDGRPRVANKHLAVIDAGPVRLVVLDSLMMPNFTPGFLGKAQRTWLEEYLRAAPPVPTLIAVHHTLDDGDTSLLDAERLLRIVKPLRQVKAVLYGHSHNYRYDSEDGLHLINLPAAGYNFRDTEPVGWVEAALSKEGGDFKLHAIGGNTEASGKTTSLAWRT